MKKLYVVDVEADSLHPTKIWCMSYCEVGTRDIRSTTSYKAMRRLLSNPDIIIIGHNFYRWDAVHLMRLLEVEMKNEIVDTLAISWVLHSKRPKHGLEDWGEYYGFPKVSVNDEEWSGPVGGMTKASHMKLMIERCDRDVLININLWDDQWAKLLEIYEGDEDEVWRYIRYLMFKMDCAREQEASRWKLDVERCTEGLETLEAAKLAKVVDLIAAMPPVPKIAKRSRPKELYKKNGDLSVYGQRWVDLCAEHGRSSAFNGEIGVITGYKEPKPTSPQQVKDWLYSFGWRPIHLKYVRDKETNEVRTIPQVKSEFVDGEVCDSVKALFDMEPKLELLSGLGILTHRIGVLKGYLNNVDEDGYVSALIQGLTNTLRFKHKVVLNLPGVDKPHGELMRGVLIAPEGYELCGADMASLEDRTGMHYQYPLDPEYVEKKSTEGYDPHTTMCISAGLITEEEEEFYKWMKAKY
jgi:hypothetical protein